MKVKAAVLYEWDKPLVIEDVTLEPPGRKEARVRIAAAAVCHSDVHGTKGEHGTFKLPALLGHEVAGYVDEVGEDVTYVKPGDPVICSLARAGCGHCYYCTIGLPNFCETWDYNFKRPGPYFNKDGERLTLFLEFAGFAEYTNVDELMLVKIPADMPMDRASLLACGVMSGFCSVIHAAKVQPFSSVVVMGAGGVGVNAVQGAAFVGAYPVIALDVLDSRLEAARAFGATHTINVSKVSDPVAAVKELTYGRGADYLFVTAAGISLKRQGFMMLAKNGVEVFIGHGTAEYMSDWDAVEFVRGRTVTGSAMGASRTRVDVPRLIELYRAGRLKLDELITARYSFDRINEAMQATARGEGLRHVIMF